MELKTNDSDTLEIHKVDVDESKNIIQNAKHSKKKSKTYI